MQFYHLPVWLHNSFSRASRASWSALYSQRNSSCSVLSRHLYFDISVSILNICIGELFGLGCVFVGQFPVGLQRSTLVDQGLLKSFPEITEMVTSSNNSGLNTRRELHLSSLMTWILVKIMNWSEQIINFA